MSYQTKEKAKNKDNSYSASSAVNKSISISGYQILDNRPEAITQRKIQKMASNYSKSSNSILGQVYLGTKPIQRVLQDNGKHRMPINEDELKDDIDNGNVTISSGQTFHTNQDVSNVGESKKWTVSYNVNKLDFLKFGHDFEGNIMSYVIHAHYDVMDRVIQMHAKTSDSGNVIFYVNNGEIQNQISNA